MSLSYFWRLFFLCSAAFFLLNAAIGLLLRFASPALVRLAQGMQPRRAARFLLIVRMLPVTAASFAVLGLCIPSYLWLEPGATHEEVGLAFVFAALLGAALCALSLSRAIRALSSTFRFTRECRELGEEIILPGESSPAIVIEGSTPVLAMAGVFRPRIVISRCVLEALSREQLDATIRHELAHRTSRDNLKRLLLLLSPEIFPFTHAFSALDRVWLTSSEWSADDSATGEDALRSLSLASALVRVARMGEAPRLSPLCQALVSGGQDLTARVDRLLHPAPPRQEPFTRVRSLSLAAAAAGTLFLGVAAFRPATLHLVHEILEHLTH